MNASRGGKLLLGWFLLAVLLVALLFVAGRWVLEETLRERLGEHLLLTLDESLFSNAQGRVNDRSALERLGRQINLAMTDLVANRWLAAQRDCSVHLLRIDDVVVTDDPSVKKSMTLSLPRNQVDREVDLALACAPGWPGAMAVAGVLGVGFLSLYLLLPVPLSGAHREWIKTLLDHGYAEEEAFAIVSRYDAQRLTLNPVQLEWVDRLHDRDAHNFAHVLAVVTDPRVMQLGEDEAAWVLLGLQRDPGDLSGALALGRAEDSMLIDLDRLTLTVRGLDVAISRTPLFYLAWYAMHRLEGEGWITNPASNRPDAEAAGSLIELMARHEGHARAINDLQQAGLKARTLDQNRSKIKEDIVAVLGESLATRYLFEAEKHPDGVRMRYRLRLGARQIRLVT